MRLLRKVASYAGVNAIQPTHMSLAPVVYDPNLIKEMSEILLKNNCYSYRGKPIVTAETGVETGSTRLIQKYMSGKSLPFKPQEWKELVSQAFAILNDYNWYPLATLIIGLPDENEDDIIETLELIDDLRDFKIFYVPVLFVPLERCFLNDQSGAELYEFSQLRWTVLTECWEHNLRVWQPFIPELLNCKSLIYNTLTKFIIPSIGFVAGYYYGAKHGRIVRNSIRNFTKYFEKECSDIT